MKQPIIKKRTLTTLIINQLEQALAQAINAANEAHAAAVDDQSIAETQYDTLAIEASYLAEGQSRRVQELQTAIRKYQSLNLIDFDENKPIALTALVQLSNDKSSQHWFFIGPAAGGLRCAISGQQVTVITPQSPMGMALIGKYQEDEIDIKLGNKQLNDYFSQVI
ncbi:hypothetical protein [Colwellia sp. E150_009]